MKYHKVLLERRVYPLPYKPKYHDCLFLFCHFLAVSVSSSKMCVGRRTFPWTPLVPSDYATVLEAYFCIARQSLLSVMWNYGLVNKISQQYSCNRSNRMYELSKYIVCNLHHSCQLKPVQFKCNLHIKKQLAYKLTPLFCKLHSFPHSLIVRNQEF